MIYNYSKLLGRMKEKNYTQEHLSDLVGMSPATLNQKLKSKVMFRQDEIEAITKALEIDGTDMELYFFAH